VTAIRGGCDAAMDVVDWLLDSDPGIRWQVRAMSRTPSGGGRSRARARFARVTAAAILARQAPGGA
jgi:hypothetical protein